MSQYRIISICHQRTINIINCAQEGASLITKQEAVKKKKSAFASTSRPHKQNGFRVSRIYAHVNDPDQVVVL